MFAAILPILGGLLQVALLWLKHHLEKKAEKKQEIKELRDEFKEALNARDYSKLTLLWNRANRMR